ncbi:MAG TPA: hypothetical protein PKH10_05795, partial [bacterium]|nr:hypothetical protein [bacterium]
MKVSSHVMLFLFATLFSFYVYASQTNYQYQVTGNEISVEFYGNQALFSNGAGHETPGYPDMRHFNVYFLLPDDYVPSNISVSLDNVESENILGEWEVPPVKPETMYVDGQPVEYMPDKTNVVHGKNMIAYSRNNYIFGSFLGSYVITSANRYNILRVTIYPFDYNPFTKELKKLTSGTLTVSLDTNNIIDIPHDLSLTKRKLLSELSDMVVNSNHIVVRTQSFIRPLLSFIPTIQAINGNTNDRYYIVTTEDVVQNSLYLGKFIASKKNRGMTVYLVTEEKTRKDGIIIESSGWGQVGLVGDSAANALRSYLKAGYPPKYLDIDYLLLIGNPHPGTCVRRAGMLTNPEDDKNPDNSPADTLTCLNEGQDAGTLPMKRINMFSNSEWEGYCSNWNWAMGRCDGVWYPANDVRRSTPSDLYYAELSNVLVGHTIKDPWDLDNDGLVGENELKIDLRNDNELINLDIKPDIMVGRIPIYTRNRFPPAISGPDYESLDRVFSEIIKYENESKHSVSQWRNNMFLPMDQLSEKHPGWYSAEITMDSLPATIDFKYTIYDEQYFNEATGLNTKEYDNNFNDCDNMGTSYKTCAMPVVTGNDLCDITKIGVSHYIPCLLAAGDIGAQLQECDGISWVNNGTCFDNGSENKNLDASIPILDFNCICTIDWTAYRSYLGNPIQDSTASDPLHGNIDQECVDAPCELTYDHYDFGLVFSNAHGGRDSTGGIITSTHVTNHPKDRRSIWFTQSCQNGWPEDPRNLGTRLLYNSSVVVVAGTRNMQYDSNCFDEIKDAFDCFSTDDPTVESGDTFAYFFFKSLTDESLSDRITAGQAYRKMHNVIVGDNHRRNRIQFNMYGDPSLGLDTYSKKGNDSDGDGVIDEFDPCPHNAAVTRWGQDLDGDGVSDVYDSDDDGVADICDNCLGLPNPYVKADKEIIFGARINANTIGQTTIYNGEYYWQPDHDLDGVGDVCDTQSDYIEPKSFHGSYKDNPSTKIRTQNEYAVFYVKAESFQSDKDLRATTRKCWVNNDRKNRWGDPGLCTTEKEIYDIENCKHTFGYSHGSDPNAYFDFKETWREISWSKNVGYNAETVLSSHWYQYNYPAWDESKPMQGERANDTGYLHIKGNIEGKKPVSMELYWNWRDDMVYDDETYAKSKVETPRNISGFPWAEDSAVAWELNDFYVVLSSGVKGPGAIYQSNNVINPEFFRIDGTTGQPVPRFARTARLQYDPIPLTYYNFSIRDIPLKEDKYIIDQYHYFEKRLSELVVDKREAGGALIQKWKVSTGGNIDITYKRKSSSMLAMVPSIDGNDYGIEKRPLVEGGATYHLVRSLSSSFGDWQDLGEITVPNNETNFEIEAYYHDGQDLYVTTKYLTGNVASVTVKELYRVPGPIILICEGGFLPVHTPIKLADVSPDMEHITIHALGEKKYLLGSDSTGMKLYELTETELIAISTPTGIGVRDFYNAAVVDGALYLAGGGNPSTEYKDVWKYSSSQGWQQLASGLNADLYKVFIAGTDGILYLTSQIPINGNIVDQITMTYDGGSVSVGKITLADFSSTAHEYCLYDDGALLKGGIGSYETCQPFIRPWYKSFSIGTTVYSVAGKGDRLYVGTNSTIRVYDISDPNAMVLKSTFTTNRRVYDLEVAEGDIMYAATSGGIYKFNTANPDALSQLSFFSTPYNYQYRIQLYNDKLYVGDDNGINI